MKKSVLLLTAILITVLSYAGNAKYQQKMGEMLAKFGACKTVDDYQKVGNQFQVIANVEKTEWLPLYYHAQCYILMSFMEQEATQKDSYLDVAEQSITKILELAPKESEAHVLQGFLYTGRLVVDPQNRGQKYGVLSAQSIGMALGLDAENPRAKYMKIANEKGTAEFFGQDTKMFCEQAVELLAKWDDYKIKSPLYPNWGKAQVQGLVNTCGE